MNNELNSQAKKIKPVIHLPWYKTQWGAGVIFGLWVGLLAGMPMAFVIYKIAKAVVHLIEGV